MRYDLKYSERIQETEFCCEHSLVQELLEALGNTRDYESIELLADADLITKVTRILLNIELDGIPFTFGMYDIDGEGNDYVGEYILTINDDLTIWCEPAYRNGKLISSEAFITYFHDDCNPEILEQLIDYKARVMLFNIDCNC